MKLVIFLLALGVTGAIAKPRAQAEEAEEENSSGEDSNDSAEEEIFEYTIIAERVARGFSGTEIQLNESSSSPDKITYLKKFDDEYPLIVKIIVTHDIKQLFPKIIYSSSRKNACDDPDDKSWDSAAIKIIQETIIPDGHCPVKEGQYDSIRKASPVNVENNVLDCGNYELLIYLHPGNSKKYSATLTYKFTIDDVEKCYE